jgi:lactoylglutathione lyase family protein
MAYPRAFSHIGISVPDIDSAVEWYSRVLGLNVLMRPTQNDGDDSHIGRLNRGVFGENFRRSRVAHLSTSNGIGLELFQFIDPPAEKPADNFEYWKCGTFHFCIVDPDIEGLAAAVAASGGKVRGTICTLFPGKPYRMVYCEDPFGIPFEIYSHSYESFFSNAAY